MHTRVLTLWRILSSLSDSSLVGRSMGSAGSTAATAVSAEGAAEALRAKMLPPESMWRWLADDACRRAELENAADAVKQLPLMLCDSIRAIGTIRTARSIAARVRLEAIVEEGGCAQ